MSTNLFPDGTKIEFAYKRFFLIFPDGARRPLTAPIEPIKNPTCWDMREVGLGEDMIHAVQTHMKANAAVPPELWWDWLKSLPSAPKAGDESTQAAR